MELISGRAKVWEYLDSVNIDLHFKKNGEVLSEFHLAFSEKQVHLNAKGTAEGHQCVHRDLPRPLVLDLEEIPAWIFKYPYSTSVYELHERKKKATILLGGEALVGAIENLDQLEQNYCAFSTRTCLPRNQVASVPKTSLLHKRL